MKKRNHLATVIIYLTSQLADNNKTPKIRPTTNNKQTIYKSKRPII